MDKVLTVLGQQEQAGIHANGIKIDICDKNNFSEMSNKQVNDASASASEATITMDAFDAN